MKKSWNHFKNYVLLLSMAIGLVLSACTQIQQKKKDQPNILLVISDDMGTEIGCYGDPQANTTNLDRFAREGIMFTRAYVTHSSCSSSRSSILTGLYPHQNGQVGLSHRGFSMHEGILSLANALKQSGYYTGVMGKIHVYPREAHDYDFAMGGLDTPAPGNNSKWMEGDFRVLNQDFEEEFHRIEFMRLVDLVADTVAAFIENAGEKPFFLHVNYIDPHAPYYQEVESYPGNMLEPGNLEGLPHFGESNVNRNRLAGYYNACARVDQGFGMILEKLEASGKMENTLILFIGDNGSPGPRGKASMFEAGLRIPFILKMPGQDEARIINEMVSTVDIMPTFLDLAGAEIPEGLEGMSILPLLEGGVPWRDHIFAEFTFHTEDSFFPARSINDGQYKLIYNPMAPIYLEALKTDGGDDRYGRYAATPEIQLFDLESDPYEFNNLSGDPDYQSIKEHLMGELNTWQKQTEDPLLDQGMMKEYSKIVSQFINGERDGSDKWEPLGTKLFE